jgi:GT2 family glycosyltransferase/glycosyltransferase involved in cell wall biosynthesis
LNSGSTIYDCLNSICRQKYPSIEILIIDGCSTDSTIEIAKSMLTGFDNVILSEIDNGIYDAINKGIEFSTGEYIIVLGSDDILYNDNVLNNIFGLNFEYADFIYGNVINKSTGAIYDGKFDILKLLDKNICHQAIFYHKTVFEKLGNYNAEYRVCADFLFNIKCFNSGYISIRYIDEIVSVYCDTGFSTKIVDELFNLHFESNIRKFGSEKLYEIYKLKRSLDDATLSITECGQKLVVDSQQLAELNQQLTEHNRQLAERDQQLIERDRQLAELGQQLSGLKRQLTEIEQHLADRDALINLQGRNIEDLLNSYSWKVTRPLRTLYELRNISSLTQMMPSPIKNPAADTKLSPSPTNCSETNVPAPKLRTRLIRHPLTIIRGINHDTLRLAVGYIKSGDFKRLATGINCYLDQNAPKPEFHPETVYGTLAPESRIIIPPCSEPLVSLIIPAHNQWAHTHACLATVVRHSDDIPYEVIVADDVSTDETKNISAHVDNILHIRNDENLGFLLNCNHAAQRARGKYLLFLNNDTNVQKDWLKHLLDLVENDASIGMVGSKLVYPDGRLQEAGGIIWKDANGLNYGRLDDPRKPEYNYLKDVDYISGACIMIRKELWDQIGGFDEQFTPAYYEDTDLAFMVRKLGYRVVFQPKSVVVHFEGISHGTDLGSGIKSYQVRNKELFLNKWRKVLETEQFAIDENIFQARDRSRNKKTILFIDYQVPLFDMFAGSRTNYMYLQMLVKMGLNVKFIGADFLNIEPYSTALNGLGIETLDGDWYKNNWQKWIMESAEHLDYVLFNKPDPTNIFIDFIREHTTAKILYQGHDLHYLRLKRKYEIEGGKALLAESLEYERIEKEIFAKSDAILTFSSFENEVIRAIVPHKVVETVPLYFYDYFKPIKTDFAKRKNILFVGGFDHTPNLDAVSWFVQYVLPHVLQATPELVLDVVGSNPPDKIMKLASDSVRIMGFISDNRLNEIYDCVRMVVVPLRFGAGVKGKTIEALYHGLPIVSTSVGIEGIPGIEELVNPADTHEQFAAQIVELYSDPERLKEISTRNNDFVKRNYSTEMATATMRNILAHLQ